jgi:hypothetical protein
LKGIAHQIWPAATFLTQYILNNLNNFFPQSDEIIDLVILEVGAGLGATSLYLAKVLELYPHINASQTYVTDLPEVVENLETNIQRNELFGRVKSSVLRWGNREDLLIFFNCLIDLNKPVHLMVLGADVIYWESLFDPLIQTLLDIIELSNSSSYILSLTVVIAHIKRWKKDQVFFKRCRKKLPKGYSFDCVCEEIINRDEEELPVSINAKEIRRIYQILKVEHTSEDHVA